MCSKNCLVNSIEMLRENAWQHALKYKFDPVVGKIYEDQLKNLNAILDHAQEPQHENV